jgi:hypothetical protein
MYDAADSCRPALVDFIEAGAGPLVVLVHSSMAGARQWSSLIRDLERLFASEPSISSAMAEPRPGPTQRSDQAARNSVIQHARSLAAQPRSCVT